MKKNELIGILKDAEEMGDAIAQEHDGHGCSTGEAGRIIRDTCHRAYQALAAGNGPAQVATDTYRRNWEGIFGAKQQRGEA